MDFPSRLKQLRRQKNLTQEQLGQQVGVTKVSISLYESGRRNPDLETITKIADVLEVSVDYLLGRTDAPDRTIAATAVGVGDPKICRWFEELLRAPQECREELKKIWDIIKKRR
ncbi:helix-turn-helix domain-containing protein [Polycladomyces subterraneus]|uniref:Helix-turn-helix domain-containing protein n=1 Tax=Polycladomyces subterraneus TaxID=1016997 RepID=A0ABT8IL78_9BACL|nr:helix-turn-helix transcriptional regulator [Polycladomyces subterraneus]MDN4593541.1 helix-turn-helix domain-containing protein [Polycladomyces subterraneus]